MTPGQQALVVAAGFLAGGINGIAGGGSLVSFPALIALGQPALAANVTSTVGIWPGYLGGVIGFRREVSDQGGRIRSLLPATLAGAVAGAALLLTTPSDAFEAIAPFLILAACALFAAQPLLTRRLDRDGRDDLDRGGGAEASGHGDRDGAGAPGPTTRAAPRRPGPAVQAGGFLAATYGAYFGAGLGVVLLALFGTLLPDRLVRTTSLRTVLSLVTNTVAAGVFLVAAPVDWGKAGLLAGGALVGGFAGARVARRIPGALLRVVVITIGVAGAVRLLAG